MADDEEALTPAEMLALLDEAVERLPGTMGRAFRMREIQGRTTEEITRALNAFLGTLTPENRRLFVRRYWYVDTVAEIAQRYNMSESKVKTRLHRIREKLRVYLMQEGIAV